MRSLRISTKVFLAFTAMLVIFATVLGYGIYKMRGIQRATWLIHHCYVPLSLNLSEAHTDLAAYDAVLDERDQVVLRKVVQAQKVLYPFAQWVDAKLIRADELVALGKERSAESSELEFLEHAATTLTEMRSQVKQFATDSEGFRRAVLEGDWDRAFELQQALRGTVGLMQRTLFDLNSQTRVEIGQAITRTGESERETAWGLIVLSLVAGLISLAGMFVVHRTLRPIRELTEAARDIGGGEYTAKVDVARRDEIGQLAQEFNRMVDNIQGRDSALRERRDELEALRAYNEGIINSVASGIIAIDREGRIQRINQAAERLWRLEGDEVVELPVLELSPFGSVPGLADLFDEVLRGERPEKMRAVPMDVERSGGTMREHPRFDLLLVPLRSRMEGTVDGVLMLGADVTLELRTKAELIKKERLAAIGRMTSQVTHELRNPLSSIGLNAEMLEEELVELETSPAQVEALELLHAIMQEVDRLAGITEEYLAYGRLPTARPEPTDVHAIVSDLLDFLKEELSRRQVQAKRSLLPGELRVQGDPNQLRRAFMNLVRNAVDAMDEGGTLTVETRRGEDFAVIEIGDSGPGIPEEDLAHIFDPFFSTKETGTGLGLALTSQIIEEHGGRILAASTMGQGTVFRIELPLID